MRAQQYNLFHFSRFFCAIPQAPSEIKPSLLIEAISYLPFQLAAQWLGFDILRATKGVCHGDELFLMFQSSQIPLKTIMSEEDKQVSQYLWEMWTNFAKTGDPTPGHTTVNGVKWEM